MENGMRYVDLSGVWRCEIPGQTADMRVPGTLDESGIGFPDDPRCQWKVDEVRRIGFYRDGDPIVTRLTRKHTFEGPACLSRHLNWEMPRGKRVFAEVERARHLQLRVNGREALAYCPGNCVTPAVFEVTGLVNGRDEFLFLSDNSMPAWPRDAIVYASAASDETQTNWNGLLGFVRLRIEQPCFLSAARVLPRGNTVDVEVEIDGTEPWAGTVHLQSDAFAQEARAVALESGRHRVRFPGIPLRPDVKRWDLEEGNLYELTVWADGLESRVFSFGVRDFAAMDGVLALNGHRVFLRSEANCAVFPETGYIPMTAEAWTEIIRMYQRYGVNCLRFHSHCPPEAAFEAADRLGMLMQPELSHWDPEHAFASPESRRYYEAELMALLRWLANHPSFVMLTFGNELHADASGHAFMDRLLALARETDDTRLYANGSNPHYGQLGTDPSSDFYTAMGFRGMEMRATCDGMTGWLNGEYPNACHQYDATMAAIRKETDQPVFSFEVGQYEVLPDLEEIAMYRGVTSPENLKHIRAKVRREGLEDCWKRMVEATGESSLLCYRAEVESALRTRDYSGISLLGVQDFPGQGTALVGMMNAHLQPKPYAFASPERFRAFFRDALPLALLPRFTFTAGERAAVPLQMANYGRKDWTDTPRWRLCRGAEEIARGALPPATAPAGTLTGLGKISLPLDKPGRFTLTIAFGGEKNEYPLWVYTDEPPVRPEQVYECRTLDEQAVAVLAAGGRVYLAPDSTEAALPRSIRAQFSPDFWSVCTFPHQAGGMGQWIDEKHPIFSSFPTESYSNWQWWPMANQRAMILPGRIRCIVAEMDSYAFLRPMAKLFECRCGGGRLMVSSLGLHQLKQYPEARALQRAIYAYLGSDQFAPQQTLPLSWIRELL